MTHRDVFVVSTARTAIGTFGGSLKDVPNTQLATTAVKAAKPDVTLLVAGAPGDNEAAWRAAGVDDFVNVRSNNYELNAQLLKKAGVI